MKLQRYKQPVVILASLTIAMSAFISPVFAASKSTAVNPTPTWNWYIDDQLKTSKTPLQTSKNGSYSVSIIELAKILGIPVKIDPKTKTVYFGKLPAAQNIIAKYKVGKTIKTLTEKELNQYVDYICFYNQSYNQYRKDPEFLKDMAQKYVLLDWNASQANNSDKLISINKSLTVLRDLKAQFSTNQSLAAAWSSLTIDEASFRRFIKLEVQAIAHEKSLVTDAQVKQDYDDAIASDAMTIADVRHILVATADTSGQALRTEEDALKKAQDLHDQIVKGASLANLAKTDSDDPGSATNGGLYANAKISDWVTGFKDAAKTLPLNTLSDPVKTEYGYHLIIVEKRSTKTFDEAKTELKEAHARTALTDRLSAGMNDIIISIQSPTNFFNSIK